jgi:hypothetical protein
MVVFSDVFVRFKAFLETCCQPRVIGGDESLPSDFAEVFFGAPEKAAGGRIGRENRAVGNGKKNGIRGVVE